MILGSFHPTISTSPTARLVALAGATFVYVTFEVFPVGLIQDIAHSVDVTQSQVGRLLGGYTIIAAVATIPMRVLASRVSLVTAFIVHCRHVGGERGQQHSVSRHRASAFECPWYALT